MYINYWKNTFNYTGVSKPSHFAFNILINVVIVILINLSGFLVPFQMENLIVNISLIVQFLMIFPTLSMLVRVIRYFKNK